MPLAHILLNHREDAIAGFENAIRIAQHEAHARTGTASSREPVIVAMLALEGVPYITNTLCAILQPHHIACTVASVFCHQRSEVGR